EFFFEIDDFFNLSQEPWIDFGELKYFFHGETGSQGVTQEENAFGVWHTQLLNYEFTGKDVAILKNPLTKAPGLAIPAQAGASDFKGTESLLKGFFESPPNGHGFTNTLHLSIEGGVGLRKFFERKTRYLGDDVIN